MYERLIETVTVLIVTMTVALMVVLFSFPQLHELALQYQESRLGVMERQSVYSTIQENTDEVDGGQGESASTLLAGHQLRLQVPEGVTTENVQIDADYVNRLVTITIDGIGKNYFDDYPVYGSSDYIVDITYESEALVGIIQVTLNDVREATCSQDGDNIYFDFVDPHDIYDYVICVDAGHGGSVPGASKQGVNEKDVNLDIALALKTYFDKSDKNIGVYYTRTTDCNPTLAQRVDLSNDSGADLFISIHNNSTSSGRMSSINGTEVMYHGGDTTGESKVFAQMCLDNLTEALGTRSRGTVVGDDIYIIRESKAPMALVEVGYMTNKDELEDLQDTEYQKKAAKAIYDAAIDYLYN